MKLAIRFQWKNIMQENTNWISIGVGQSVFSDWIQLNLIHKTQPTTHPEMVFVFRSFFRFKFRMIASVVAAIERNANGQLRETESIADQIAEHGTMAKRKMDDDRSIA